MRDFKTKFSCESTMLVASVNTAAVPADLASSLSLKPCREPSFFNYLMTFIYLSLAVPKFCKYCYQSAFAE